MTLKTARFFRVPLRPCNYLFNLCVNCLLFISYASSKNKLYYYYYYYKFTCSCDTNLTYIGMSSRHLSTRVREHLNLNSKQKSSIKDHIAACNFCSKTKIGIDSFKIIRKCRSDYDTKIHEALLIKKHSPGLNRQLYASGASFLLQVF